MGKESVSNKYREESGILTWRGVKMALSNTSEDTQLEMDKTYKV